MKTSGITSNDGQFSNREVLCVDGQATVAGLSVHYICDGGCDRATVNEEYAKAIEKAGKKINWLEEARTATLCDGSTADIIVGEIDTDITLITCAGLVEIPRATVDVLRGPQKGHILYVGQQEEERLGLVSYADQVKLLAARLNTDKNVDTKKVRTSRVQKRQARGKPSN